MQGNGRLKPFRFVANTGHATVNMRRETNTSMARDPHRHLVANGTYPERGVSNIGADH